MNDSVYSYREVILHLFTQWAHLESDAGRGVLVSPGWESFLPLLAHWQWQCCHLCCIWSVTLLLAPESHTLCWCKTQELQLHLHESSLQVCPISEQATPHKKLSKHTSTCKHRNIYRHSSYSLEVSHSKQYQACILLYFTNSVCYN